VKRVGVALVLVGCLASFAMGANDVALASGALVGPGVLSPHRPGCSAASRWRSACC
jgi:hypothetical protein